MRGRGEHEADRPGIQSGPDELTGRFQQEGIGFVELHAVCCRTPIRPVLGRRDRDGERQLLGAPCSRLIRVS